MERPQSIVWFERLYLGGVMLGLMNTAINWPTVQAQVAAAPNAALLPSWFSYVTVAIGIGINLVLWYFVAQRGSVVAKWIVTILFGLGALSMAWMFANGAVPATVNIVSVIVLLLHAGAVFMLFRPDTRSWFGESN